MSLLNSLMFTTGIDGAGFKRGLLGIQAAGDRAGKEIAANLTANSKTYITAALGAFAALVKIGYDHANQIVDASDHYGLLTGDVQDLSAKADQAGVELDSVAKALDKIGEARAKAAAGDKTSISALETFGVSKLAATSAGITNLQILKMIGAGINGGGSDDQRRVFADLVGERGKKLLKFVQDINSEGPIVIVKPDQLASIDALGDKLATLWQNVKGLIAGGIAGVVQNVEQGYGKAGIFGAIVGALSPTVSAAFGIGRSLANDPELIPDATAEKIKAPMKDVAEARAKRRGASVISSRSDAVDSLAQVGLFVRGGSGSLYEINREMRDVLRRMERDQSRLINVVREVL